TGHIARTVSAPASACRTDARNWVSDDAQMAGRADIWVARRFVRPRAAPVGRRGSKAPDRVDRAVQVGRGAPQRRVSAVKAAAGNEGVGRQTNVHDRRGSVVESGNGVTVL